MPEKAQVLAESQSAEAAQAAAVSSEATQKAIAAQVEAASFAAIEKFFNRGVQEKKFIDIGRIPFICDDINGLHLEMKEINKTITAWDEDRVTQTDFQLLKQQSDLTNKIVLAACGIILVAVLAAIVGLVIIK